MLVGLTITQYVRTSWPFTEDSPGTVPGVANASQGEHAGHGDVPAGYAAVMLDPAQVEAIGLASAAVEQRDLTRTVRTVGVVGFDETRTAHVHAKVRGFIETIQANYVGRVGNRRPHLGK